jgi:hypothetical protein
VFYNIQCSPQGTQQCIISISAIQGGKHADWTHTKGTQQCNTSATVTPQSANHNSLTQGQMYISQTVNVQLMVISVQQFTV